MRPQSVRPARRAVRGGNVCDDRKLVQKQVGRVVTHHKANITRRNAVLQLAVNAVSAGFLVQRAGDVQRAVPRFAVGRPFYAHALRRGDAGADFMIIGNFKHINSIDDFAQIDCEGQRVGLAVIRPARVGIAEVSLRVQPVGQLAAVGVGIAVDRRRPRVRLPAGDDGAVDRLERFCRRTALLRRAYFAGEGVAVRRRRRARFLRCGCAGRQAEQYGQQQAEKTSSFHDRSFLSELQSVPAVSAAKSSA